MPGYSPRLRGEDAEHVARLAELDESLPPILVERSTMRVIDGMHRVMAACAKGRTTIEVRFFDGAAEEAFLLAVRSNMAHGLPLSREDRRAAAQRILAQWPHLSDRAVARTAGVGARTVAALRSTSAGVTPYPRTRRGTDGKVRPLDGAEGRWRAAELLTERPHASLREVARHAGISPATVSDVRKRLASGRPPVPERDAPEKRPTADAEACAKSRGSMVEETVSVVRPIRSSEDSPMDKLLRDPSLRHKESGRRLLRLLQRSAVERGDLLTMTGAVPAHCTDLVADLARKYAQMWAEFAREVAEADG
ncbi:transcriptional regulator [Streptomyces yokosukanensis]|uniref:ParB/RepB/Spo0J family partition protein n=1 Tax=Streptomyces yokosukanensis TaxID=67386 RepID=UPI001FC9441D|nr:transcriptional regulator [Streptomyces yokosukanensis]